MSRYLVQLARALDTTREAEVKRDLISRAHDTMHELSTGGTGPLIDAAEAEIAPYLEILIEIRNEMRAANQYELADEIRKRLAGLNIVLQDSSVGTSWRKLGVGKLSSSDI